MAITGDFIQRGVTAGDYELSLHADVERSADGLTIDDVEAALSSCELLEDYPDDPGGQSVLC